MHFAVVTPPAAIVTLAEAKGFLGISGTGDDAVLMMLIEAAQAQIEPPNGFTGRAFGIQVIEATFERCEWADCGLRLWYPPFISIVSVTYLDAAGDEQTLPADCYKTSDWGAFTIIAPVSSGSWPTDATGTIRVRYQAGYAGTDPQLKPAKMAIILGVQETRSLARDVLLKREVTDGVGATEWHVPDTATSLMKTAAERLLQGYKVYYP